MDPETIKNILEQINAYGDRMLIFQDLSPIKNENHISLICPKCGQRSAVAYQPDSRKASQTIRCSRTDKCGYQTNFIQYISGQIKPQGQDLIKAVMILTKRTGIGITTERIHFDDELVQQKPEPEKKNDFDPLGNDIIKKYKTMALDAMGIIYLEQRGISLDTAIKFGIKNVPWGRWPHYILDEYTGEKVLVRQWHPGRLVIPVYDNQGQLICLYGRAIPGDHEIIKKLKHDFIGATKGIFNQIALEEETVHITEGAFDALSIIEAGKKEGCEKNACSIFGVTGLKWEHVKSKNVIFCFDPDKAGNEWIKIARQGLKLGKRIFSLSNEIYMGHKDLAELWEKNRNIEFQYSEFT